MAKGDGGSAATLMQEKGERESGCRYAPDAGQSEHKRGEHNKRAGANLSPSCMPVLRLLHLATVPQMK